MPDEEISDVPCLRLPVRSRLARLGLVTALALSGACSGASTDPVTAGVGPSPKLPEPETRLFPNVDIAPARGWPDAASRPMPAAGLAVQAFAKDLDHPRWLYVLPNGDVLVAETNAPERPDEYVGIRGHAMAFVMKRAGAGTPSADRISLLRDADGDGIAETRKPFLEHLHSPFGMALVGESFYVAEADALVRYRLESGKEVPTPSSREVVAPLPGGPRNHHWTKSLIASADGRTLYVGVGSNSNAAENGIEVEKDRASILAIDAQTGASRVFADGLRNPVGLAWEPETGELWTAVNERDEIGNDLVPDYMTSVKEGAFYGWPWSYYGPHVDARVKPPRPDKVASARVPDYALGPHTASLGLASAKGNALPPAFASGMFVGQHGSWNRTPLSGYKVIFVPFRGGKPSGLPIDVLTGFVNDEGEALGRPVGVTLDGRGALLVADDVGNRVWRVTRTAP